MYVTSFIIFFFWFTLLVCFEVYIIVADLNGPTLVVIVGKICNLLNYHQFDSS